MQAHQQRVIDEKKELDDKVTKLVSFITESPIYKTLPEDERERLNRQEVHMQNYSFVLGERIAAFTDQ